MDRLKNLEVFIAVAEAGSLAGAARKLGISAPSVTRLLGELEEEVGSVLFHRTTRSVSLTDVGQGFLDDATALVQGYADALDVARGASQDPQGVLRVTASVMFGHHYVSPLILAFLDQYPAVKVEATFLDRVVSIIDEGFDVAIRIGDLADSSLMAVRVGEVRRVVCASEAYLAAHGIPQTPADLVDHRLISVKSVTPTNEWRFKDGVSTRVDPRLTVNTIPAAILAAKSDWGLTRVLSYQIGPELGNGALKTVLGEYEPDPLPIHILHPEGRGTSAKVRAFVDLVKEQLRKNPFLHR